ncbi:2OG-Fe-II oxygenase [Lactarius vividus]|nr:2OG-Fe-II oxygenase [Lactarius vividus]
MSLLEAARSANTAFSEIPIIDLKDIGDPTPAVQLALAKQIRDACIDVGFFYVTNHGVSEETIAAALESMKIYFSLPLETKMELDNTKTPNFKGYNAVLSSNNDPAGTGDMHEGFEFGWEALDDAPGALDACRMNDGSMAGANVWPDVPGFRKSLLNYYHAAVALGKNLFPLFARALDLPPDFFDDKRGPVDERVIGIGAHTDFEVSSSVMLCAADADMGRVLLQVRNTSGEWIDATPTPGTLVINLGDQFARWTNDVFKSTPIAGCVSDERPPRYEVTTAGDYVKMRLQATYGH